MNLDFSFLDWGVVSSFILKGFFFSIQLTLIAMVLMATAASALVARRTVNQPIVDALGHV